MTLRRPIPECPRCRHGLRADESAVYHCDACGGVFAWPAAQPGVHPMLARIETSRAEALRSPEHGMGTKRCPGCSASPRALSFFEVPIDWCPACGGVWLDGGEAAALRQSVERLRAQVADDAFSPYRVSAHAAAAAVVLGRVTCSLCARQVPVNETYVTGDGVLCVPCGRRQNDELPSPETEAEIAAFLDTPAEVTVSGRGALAWLRRLLG